MASKERFKTTFVYDGEAELSDIFADLIASKIKEKSQGINLESGGDVGYTDSCIKTFASRQSNGEDDDTNTNE